LRERPERLRLKLLTIQSYELAEFVQLE